MNRERRNVGQLESVAVEARALARTTDYFSLFGLRLRRRAACAFSWRASLGFM